MNASTLPNVNFNMVRADMADIPQYRLPPGYRFRTYRPGDDVTWLTVQRAAEPFIAMPDDYFTRQYGNYLVALPDRMFFVETEQGEPAGTISAWWEDDDTEPPSGRGRIHWVAVHPAHQRRGLAKPMMTRAMHRLAQDHSSAVLGTSSGRPWAVKVYLDFGFRPESDELADADIYAAWQRVQGVIQHPVLAQVLGRNA
jgi:ribosomal protein S18 acetylase RimI-like enzyme